LGALFQVTHARRGLGLDLTWYPRRAWPQTSPNQGLETKLTWWVGVLGDSWCHPDATWGLLGSRVWRHSPGRLEWGHGAVTNGKGAKNKPRAAPHPKPSPHGHARQQGPAGHTAVCFAIARDTLGIAPDPCQGRGMLPPGGPCRFGMEIWLGQAMARQSAVAGATMHKGLAGASGEPSNCSANHTNAFLLVENGGRKL